MKSKLGLITTISTLFLYWKHVELAKIRRFRCESLKPFFSKQAQDSYYHGILAATEMACFMTRVLKRANNMSVVGHLQRFDEKRGH